MHLLLEPKGVLSSCDHGHEALVEQQIGEEWVLGAAIAAVGLVPAVQPFEGARGRRPVEVCGRGVGGARLEAEAGVDEDVQRLGEHGRQPTEAGDEVTGATQVDPWPHDFVGESLPAAGEVLAQRLECQWAAERDEHPQLGVFREPVEQIGGNHRAQAVGDNHEVGVRRDLRQQTSEDRIPAIGVGAVLDGVGEQFRHQRLRHRARGKVGAESGLNSAADARSFQVGERCPVPPGGAVVLLVR